MQRVIVNCETGEETTEELTDEEIAEMEARASEPDPFAEVEAANERKVELKDKLQAGTISEVERDELLLLLVG